MCNCELVLNVMNRMYFKFSVIGLLRKELCEGKHLTKGSRMNSILSRIILFYSGGKGVKMEFHFACIQGKPQCPQSENVMHVMRKTTEVS